MIEYIVKRTGHQEFERMIELHRWCERNYGPTDYYKQTWDVDFWDGSDDWVAFKFYDATMAFWFKHRFPEVLSVEEWGAVNDYR